MHTITLIMCLHLAVYKDFCICRLKNPLKATQRIIIHCIGDSNRVKLTHNYFPSSFSGCDASLLMPLLISTSFLCWCNYLAYLALDNSPVTGFLKVILKFPSSSENPVMDARRFLSST